MIKINKNAIDYIYNLCLLKNNFYLKIYISNNYYNYNFKMCFFNNFFLNKNKYINIFKSYFFIYIKKKYIKYIKDLEIDIISNNFNKNLIFKTSNELFKKNENVNDNNKLILQKIKYVVDNKINTILLNHNGRMEIINLSKNFILSIKFFGSCNGCLRLNDTYKNIIYKKIRKYFPYILKIIDLTNHIHGDHSYY